MCNYAQSTFLKTSLLNILIIVPSRYAWFDFMSGLSRCTSSIQYKTEVYATVPPSFRRMGIGTSKTVAMKQKAGSFYYFFLHRASFFLYVHCRLFASKFLLQFVDILVIDPFLRVPTGAANISVNEHCGKVAPPRLNVIPRSICPCLTRNPDNISAVAFGAYLCVFHTSSFSLRNPHISRFLNDVLPLLG